MRYTSLALGGALLTTCLTTLPVAAQIAVVREPTPQVVFTARADEDVAADRLTAVVAFEEAGANLPQMARILNQRTKAALAVAGTTSAGKARTGQYTTHLDHRPPTDNAARWLMRVELVLESGDFLAAAALLQRWQEQGGQIASMAFGLAPETRARAEERLRSQALHAFQQQGRQIAEALGYARFTLGQLAVHGSEGPPPGARPWGILLAESARDAVPVPLAGGDNRVTVTVTGAVQLLP